ncbi:hypothetical protein GCM10011494_17360 [Novosphingobium endophyticum]|uniref:DUF11 domain-containing protein n=1 Tax=Novosphingobium endophyticum TaxID=1955250 RepID=A0A916X5B0_9SPHN|nr:hypothetical protein [Novosphingobium endophyticum]GGB99423.1 hypothetical protein GCM10011494_17360 [Novosphingobium endophyticum]
MSCRIVVAISLALAAPPLLAERAQARPAVATDSAVFVERVMPDSSSRLEPAVRLSRGDKVVTVVTWYRMGGDGGFVITNPLPAGLAYEDSASDRQDVSVDGGRTWGHLGTLRIGNRLAAPEDVTHVRWRIPPGTAARGRGEIAYSGTVR